VRAPREELVSARHLLAKYGVVDGVGHISIHDQQNP
jgi:hypothetical protein